MLFNINWLQFNMNSFLLTDHVGPPRNWWILSLQCSTNSKHVVQSFKHKIYFLVSVLRSTPNHTPFKYRSPIKMSSNQIRPAYLTTFFHYHCPHVRGSIQVVLLWETTINVLPRKLTKLTNCRKRNSSQLQILEITKNWDWRSWNPLYLVLNCTSWSRRSPTQCKIPCNNHRPIVTSNSYHDRNQNAPEYSEKFY